MFLNTGGSSSQSGGGSAYQQDFTANNWTTVTDASGDNWGEYTLTVNAATHELTSVAHVEVLMKKDNVYVSNTWGTLAVSAQVDGANNVKLVSGSTFDGRVIIS